MAGNAGCIQRFILNKQFVIFHYRYMTFGTGDFLMRPFQFVSRIAIMHEFFRRPVIGCMAPGTVGIAGRVSGGKLPPVNIIMAVLAEFFLGGEGDMDVTPFLLPMMTFNARGSLMFSLQSEFCQTVVKGEPCPGFLVMAGFASIFTDKSIYRSMVRVGMTDQTSDRIELKAVASDLGGTVGDNMAGNAGDSQVRSGEGIIGGVMLAQAKIGRGKAGNRVAFFTGSL